MKIKLFRHILLLILFSWCLSSYSQEIRGLNYNPTLDLKAKTISFKGTEQQDTIEVPLPEGNLFFDDFSVYGTRLFPESTNWLDKNATITHSFADSAISFGVITLDCFDSEGKVYGSVGRTNPSDTLTSKVLDFSTEDKLYMSFFIQGGGKADAPDSLDFLTLEMSATDTSWTKVWESHGYESHTFDQIIIPLEEIYLADSFQFRFINYTSLSKNEVLGNEGALSNADNWHIDYIQIKSANNASEMEEVNDVALYKPLLPIFRDYSSIPYSHIKYAGSETRGRNPISYRTYFPTETSDISVGRTHVYIDKVNSDTLEINGRGDGIQSTDPAFEFIDKDDNFSVIFKTERYPSQKEGIFHLRSFLQVPTIKDQYHWNDTITRVEIFRDYYAYDDGSAEYGIGIAGSDNALATIATKFDIYHQQNTPDTLTGVYIYFNNAYDDYNADLEFEVGIWSVDGNMPGELIYSTGEDNLYTPDIDRGFNDPSTSTDGFMRINFNEDILILNSFYIGIIQHTEEFLNVGYDISLDTKSKMMYTYNGQWNSFNTLPDIPAGSLMIRPIFDHIDYSSKIKNIITTEQLNISVYPNPASEYVTLNLSDTDIYSYNYKIYNLLGKEVQASRLTSNTIDINQLPSGMYILQIQHQATKKTYSQKLLKTVY